MPGRRATAKQRETEQAELSREIHRYSMEALNLAKDYVAGVEPVETLKGRADTLRERLPQEAGRAFDATTERHPDLNRALADARLDMDYVIYDGQRPTSIRLASFIDEHRRLQA